LGLEQADPKLAPVRGGSGIKRGRPGVRSTLHQLAHDDEFAHRNVVTIQPGDILCDVVTPVVLSSQFRCQIILLSSIKQDVSVDQTYGLMPLRMIRGPYDAAFHQEGSVVDIGGAQLDTIPTNSRHSFTIQPWPLSTLGRAMTVPTTITRILSIGAVKRPIGGLRTSDCGIVAEIEMTCSRAVWMDLFVTCPSTARFVLLDDTTNVIAAGIVTRHIDTHTL
jgi:hypothetical protein